MRTLALAVVAVVAVQRLLEMRLSRRHAAGLLAAGGVESGRAQLPMIIVLHVALLAGCVVEILALDRHGLLVLALPMLLVLVGAQGVRWWTMRALGPRWTARVIVLPHVPRVRTGPYRRLGHPNYLVVVAEGIALPLLGSAWITAVVFTLLNTPLLLLRIRTEEAALAAADEPVR